MEKCLTTTHPEAVWEILVPTEMYNINGKLRPIHTRHHRVWDKRIRAITGGLTIMVPAKGHWIAPSGELFVERMIPVRLCCSEEHIQQISKITAQHYNQQAVMYYQVSTHVVVDHYR